MKIRMMILALAFGLAAWGQSGAQESSSAKAKEATASACCAKAASMKEGHSCPHAMAGDEAEAGSGCCGHMACNHAKDQAKGEDKDKGEAGEGMACMKAGSDKANSCCG